MPFKLEGVVIHSKRHQKITQPHSNNLHLQKGKLLIVRIDTGQSLPLPVSRSRSIESILARPGQFLGPGLISQIIANKIDISGIDQNRNARLVQQVQNKGRKVLHPIGMEFTINTKVTRFPTMDVVGIDAEGRHGIGFVEPRLHRRKVVTEGWLFTLFANIVRVQSRHLVGRSQSHIANNKGRLTGKTIQGTVPRVALMNQFGTLGHNSLHAFVRIFIDDLDVVAVVVHHFRVPGVLRFGIGESIANTQASQRQFDFVIRSSCLDSLVSLPDAVSNGGSVMSF